MYILALCSALLPLFFFSSCYRAHRDLHSFPTRRSSDLAGAARQHRPAAAEVAVGPGGAAAAAQAGTTWSDRKSTRLNSSHSSISYAVFCLKKKKRTIVSVSTPSRRTAVNNASAHDIAAL